MYLKNDVNKTEINDNIKINLDKCQIAKNKPKNTEKNMYKREHEKNHSNSSSEFEIKITPEYSFNHADILFDEEFDFPIAPSIRESYAVDRINELKVKFGTFDRSENSESLSNEMGKKDSE